MKSLSVSDVTWNGEAVCSPQSPAVVPETARLSSILNSFTRKPNLNYAVKNDEGTLTGLITLDHLKEALIMSDWYESLLAMDIMEPVPVICSPEMKIPDLYELFTKNDCDAIAIADANNKAVGVIEKAAIDHFLHQQVIALHKKIASLG